MKKLVTTIEVLGEGLEALLGERVLLMCGNYFYTGVLEGVNETYVKLTDSGIVYETGPWSDRKYTSEQKLHMDVWYVSRAAIESFGMGK